MSATIGQQIAALQRMSMPQLRERYAEVFGDATRTGNRTWLVRRIAWRLQSQAEGGLSQRAQDRARELACDDDVRVIPPRTATTANAVPVDTPQTVTREMAVHDTRLPPPGSVITRQYKNATVQVKVLADGFEYDGERYPSLSAVAKVITGSHCNGFHFFKLAKPNSKAGAA